tara:strand:- start:758 stop:913 length:156 start_codon:yes stop_codon:yes gene_type:complete
MCGIDTKIIPEDCVICSIETEYDRYDHIEKRKHYVVGVGQLCKKCWDETSE